jgi:hypothetical protein
VPEPVTGSTGSATLKNLQPAVDTARPSFSSTAFGAGYSRRDEFHVRDVRDIEEERERAQKKPIWLFAMLGAGSFVIGIVTVFLMLSSK